MKKTFCLAAAMLAAGTLCAGPVTSWTEQANLLTDSTTMAGATISGGVLYLVGGQNSGGDTDQVWRFPVTGASVGAGVSSTALPATNNFAYLFECTASTATNVYVAGGGWNTSVPTLWDRVHRAPINGDGSLGSWTASTTFPNSYKQQLGGAVIANGYLYVFGGNDDSGAGVLFDDCYYAQIQGDGSLGAWQTGTDLPAACWFLGSTVVGDYIIVHPGLTTAANTSVTNFVWVNHLNPTTGAMGAWTVQANTMATACYNVSLETVGNTIVAIGGRVSGGTSIATVQSAPFDTGTGTVGTWDETDADLPEAVRYHDAEYSAAEDRFYVVGAQGTNKVFISNVLTPPPPTASARGWSLYE